MKVWLLEWWCSDVDDFVYEKLFTNIDKVNDYLAVEYSEDQFIDEKSVEDGIEIVEYFDARYWMPEKERKYYNRANFRAMLVEVR